MIQRNPNISRDYLLRMYRGDTLVGEEYGELDALLAKVIAALYQTNNEYCIPERWISSRRTKFGYSRKHLYFKTLYPNYYYDIYKKSTGDLDEEQINKLIDYLCKLYEKQLRIY